MPKLFFIMLLCTLAAQGVRIQPSQALIQANETENKLPQLPALPSRWSSVLQLNKYLTSGSFGDVFVATTLKEACGTEMKVIVKKLKERPTPELWTQEIYLPTVISHANVVQVYDFLPHKVEDSHAPGNMVLLEFIGPELADSVLEMARKKDLAQILKVSLDIARGVQQIHAQGWVYRDLKPRNALVSESGVTKAIDFGLACKKGSAGCRIASGTAYYMAPETLNGMPADFPSDIFALGNTIVELWRGKPPFRTTQDLEKWAEQKNQAQLMRESQQVWDMVKQYGLDGRLPGGIFDGMPPDLVKLVQSMLHRDPRFRPTIHQVVASLSSMKGHSEAEETSSVPECLKELHQNALQDFTTTHSVGRIVPSKQQVASDSGVCSECTNGPACYMSNKCFHVADGYSAMSSSTCGPGKQYSMGIWCER